MRATESQDGMPSKHVQRFSAYRVGCRAKFGLVVNKCEELCSLMSGFGPDKDMEAQDLMARLTLDVVLQAGFGICSQYLGDLQPVPLMQELHYAMDESFR